jgi:hypothetical protein
MVCPICISLALFEVPRELSVATTFRGRAHQAQEMRVFVCTHGHVFLCRSRDVDGDLGEEEPCVEKKGCASVREAAAGSGRVA